MFETGRAVSFFWLLTRWDWKVLLKELHGVQLVSSSHKIGRLLYGNAFLLINDKHVYVSTHVYTHMYRYTHVIIYSICVNLHVFIYISLYACVLYVYI